MARRDLPTAALPPVQKNRDLESLGSVSALVFLALNGYDFTAPQDAFAETVLALAAGELAKTDVAVFIRKWAVRLA
jgi:prophage maintenance system killer protein